MRSLPKTALLALATLAAPLAATAKQPTPSTVDADFAKLSVDGQHAFVDIFNAQQALASNQPAQATPLLQDAQKHLKAAAQDHRVFVKAESDLPAAPNQPTPTHPTGTTPTTWIPMDGQYFVTESLTPEKQSALNTANQHLHQGNSKQAAQDLQVSGIDVDFILGVAPLQQTNADVYRASVFLNGHDSKDANEALTDALNSVRFIADDMTATPAPKKSQ